MAYYKLILTIMKKLFYFVFLSYCVLSTLSSCIKETDPQKFIVAFNSLGGSEVSAISVAKESKVIKPANPTKEGAVFEDWFKEEACLNVWDFNNGIVTSDITLYAKWVKDGFTVKFETNGGNEIADQFVAKDKAAEKPLIPTKYGFAFENWYKDAALTAAYDFTTPVTSNITLYAKWTQITKQMLDNLLVEAYKISHIDYTTESYNAMRAKYDAGYKLLATDNPTDDEIAKAYDELVKAINALVKAPHRAVADISFGYGIINGVLYVTPGEYTNINAYCIDAEQTFASNQDVTFAYNTTELEKWAESTIKIDKTDLTFKAKSDITAGETIEITVKSVENPAIFKVVTLTVAVEGQLKTLFLNSVNALPEPDKISYEHKDAINTAHQAYEMLSRKDTEDPEVIKAFDKLQDCSNVSSNLPDRIKYSFKGDVCTLFLMEDSVEEEIGQFTFVFNGAFPAGTYTATTWELNSDDDLYYQFMLVLNSDGTGGSKHRTSTNANGTEALEWVSESTLTYTNDGTQTTGGTIFLTFQYSDLSPRPAGKHNF